MNPLKKVVIGLFFVNFGGLLKAYVIQFNGKAVTSIEVSMPLNANTWNGGAQEIIEFF